METFNDYAVDFKVSFFNNDWGEMFYEVKPGGCIIKGTNVEKHLARALKILKEEQFCTQLSNKLGLVLDFSDFSSFEDMEKFVKLREIIYQKGLNLHLILTHKNESFTLKEIIQDNFEI